jgi:hypothetical protein
MPRCLILPRLTCIVTIGLLATRLMAQPSDESLSNLENARPDFVAPTFEEEVPGFRLLKTGDKPSWLPFVPTLNLAFGRNSNPGLVSARQASAFFSGNGGLNRTYVVPQAWSLKVGFAWEVVGYLADDARKYNADEPSLVFTYTPNLGLDDVSSVFTLKGNHQNQDYKSTGRALKFSNESARKIGAAKTSKLAVASFFERKDQLSPVLDPRKNRDASRAGIDVSVVTPLSNDLGRDSAVGLGYSHTWTWARGSDEDKQSNIGVLTFSEIILSPFASWLAMEKLEVGFEKREGQNPDSKLTAGQIRTDKVWKANMALRLLTKDPNNTWTLRVAWNDQDSLVNTSSYVQLNVNLLYRHKF